MTAPSANLLPNGMQQFVDANGAPYALGRVCFYIPATTTAKQTWSDANQTTPNTIPCVNLDAAGRCIAFGTGTYRQQLYDAANNLIWDRLTQTVSDVVKSIKDYGALGTGVDDSAAVLAAVNDAQLNSGVIGLTNGTFATTSTIGLNNVDQLTLTKTDRPDGLGIYVGSAAAPGAQQEPALWVQKYVKKDTGGATLHQTGGIFVDLEILGSGNYAAPNRGTWHGGLVSTHNAGTWNGSTAAPLYDTDGDTIGLAGFARCDVVPGNGRIIGGIWAYAEGPVVDNATFANLPAGNWAICGIEINLKTRSPDLGLQTDLLGKGATVGLLLQAFRVPGQGSTRAWNFGIALSGNPDNGNFTDTDVEHWNSHRVGMFLDLIWDRGIQFGQFARDGSYGIYFPAGYGGFQTAARAVTALTSVGTTATATLAAHGWVTGQNIIIAGVTPAGYNTPGGTLITVVDANTFTYVLTGAQAVVTVLGTAAKFQRPAAAIFLGDNVINLGQYTGTVWRAGDMWRNGGRIFHYDGAFGREVMSSIGVGNVTGQFNRQIRIQLTNVDYYINASLAATSNEILNTTGVGASVTNTVTNKVAVLINGVQYYLLASTSAA